MASGSVLGDGLGETDGLALVDGLVVAVGLGGQVAHVPWQISGWAAVGWSSVKGNGFNEAPQTAWDVVGIEAPLS